MSQGLYMDTKRSVQAGNFQSGDFVRILLPGHRQKGVLQYSEARQVVSQRGQGTILLDD